MADSHFFFFFLKKPTTWLLVLFLLHFFFFLACVDVWWWLSFLSVEGKRRDYPRLSPTLLPHKNKNNGFSGAPGSEGVGSPGCARSK